MNCPKCSHVILNADANFCPECGFRLCDAQHRYCPQCSAEITEAGTKFCSVCGYRVAVSPPVLNRETVIVTQTSGNNSKSILRAIGIALLIIGICAGIAAAIIPSTMGGWEFKYAGGQETTIAVGVVGGIALILGISMIVASGKK